MSTPESLPEIELTAVRLERLLSKARKYKAYVYVDPREVVALVKAAVELAQTAMSGDCGCVPKGAEGERLGRIAQVKT